MQQVNVIKEWLTECYDRWPRPTDGLKRGFTCAVSTRTSGPGACGTASRGLLHVVRRI